MVTTLVLQMCLFFSSLYLIIFGLFELSIQIYKYVTLPYLVGTLISELILFGLLILVEFVRIQLGKRGNLTNQTVPLISSLLLLAPSLVAVLYRYHHINSILSEFHLNSFIFQSALAELRSEGRSDFMQHPDWNAVSNLPHLHHQINISSNSTICLTYCLNT